ncbi:MAG: hypothetical protein GYA62_07875, partial [Bacteroidales bacterium]|nr:hypothetical protein [Bacteroidales bacterium]
MNLVIQRTIADQTNHQGKIQDNIRKDNGVFFTNEIEIIDSILDIVPINNDIFNKKILEPAVGNGIFFLRLIEKIYSRYPHKTKVKKFIENCLYFIDIDPQMIDRTKQNISLLYNHFFNEKYDGKFNEYIYDFTNKVRTDGTLFNEIINDKLEPLLGSFDYVIGNPPYVTLYGRRDRKKDERQRINYLNEYKQFPRTLKNGKINYVMLFLEHGLDFLKKRGELSFIIDISFFETAYKYTRKYLLENTKIIELENNIANFDGVASGQLIIKLEKNNSNDEHTVVIKDFATKKSQKINQSVWNNEKDEYKFRFNFSNGTQKILEKITTNAKSLKSQYPKKALRTCAMLLDMEDKFVSDNPKEDRNCNSYLYYQGSKAIYSKYCLPNTNKYFYYDKKLQDKINDELKQILIKKGIKNKKRIGLGDYLVYDNPKVYVRQSSKEIIATYDENLSSANNSLYVFSLKKNTPDAKEY